LELRQNETSSESDRSVKNQINTSDLAATHALDTFNPLKHFYIQIKQQ